MAPTPRAACFDAGPFGLARALGLALTLFLGLANRAEAQSEAFRDAQAAYLRADYDRVIDLLSPLVEGPTVLIRDPVLLQEAREILGAAYVLTGRPQLAEPVFDALLRQVLAVSEQQFRRYRLDPAEFLDSVHAVFDRVHARILGQLEQEQQTRAQREAEARERRRAALLMLVEMAESTEVSYEVAELPSYVPFGVGQFNNGDDIAGYTFLVTETLLFATTLGTWIAWADTWFNLPLVPTSSTPNPAYPPWAPRPLVRDPNESQAALLNTLSTINWIAAGLLVLDVAAGILEARINFRERRTIRRRREVPREILEELELGVGPGGLSIHGRF
ncbi:MAG: hypothetical protein AB7S26_42405 [Sandaracinaceae bacterium]